MSASIRHEVSTVELVSELLDSPRMYDVSEAVINYAVEDEFAATLRAMLVAHHNSYYAYKEADREQSKSDFIVFAKSFANTCLSALEVAVND